MSVVQLLHRACSPLALAPVVLCAVACNDMSSGQIPAEMRLTERIEGFVVPVGGRDVDHVFAVPNTSAGHALSLSEQRRSCGCISLSPAEQVIAPGTTGSVRMRVRVPAIPGVRRFTATLQTDTSAPTLITLELAVSVVPSVLVTPSQTAELLLSESKPASLELTVSTLAGGSDEEGEVEIQTEPSGLLVSQLGVQRRVLKTYAVDDRHFRITVPLDISAELGGRGAATVSFRIGDQRVSKVIRWRRESPVTVSPGRLFIRAPADFKMQQLRLHSSDGIPFRITAVRSSLSELAASCPTAESSREQHLITIRRSDTGHSADAATTLRTGVITVSLEHAKLAAIDVPVYIVP